MVWIFGEEHEIFRKSVRRFVEKEVIPFTDEWEENGEIPRSIWERLGELGFLGIEYPEKYGGAGGDFIYTLFSWKRSQNAVQWGPDKRRCPYRHEFTLS